MTGKQLKNSILQWAIQGKLVPQDPNDEPASVLLEKIRAEKARLVKEKKIKKDKNESIIYRGEDNSYYEKFADGTVKCIDDEIPFEIPQNWEWVRLRFVSEIARGGSPRPIKEFITSSQDGVNWIKIGDTEKDGKYINSTKEKIIKAGVTKSRMVHKGDFLLTNSMSFGRPYITNVDGCIHDGWLVISPIANSYYQDFLYFLLSSAFAYSQFADKVSGAVVKNLNSDKVSEALFPLPPTAEQYRICSKLDALIGLSSKYQAFSEDLKTLDSSLLGKIKKSILQEAIQGKLVPQIASEGTAESLLEEIRIEKERLIKEKKIKRDKLDSVIFKGDDNKYYEKNGDELNCIDDETPFEIPATWIWVRLNDICSYIQRGKSPKYSPIKKYPVVAQKCNQWSGFSIEKAQFIEPDSLHTYGEERLLQDNDLLWNSTGLGTLGRIAIYKTELNPYELAVADSHVTVIRPLKEFVLSEYLYAYFASYTVQSVIEEKSDGSTKQKELATATVKSYLIPLPPIHEQLRIVSKIKELTSIMRK
jgi:type I restriction enzyme S subunit